jgi:hypothetical protein
VPAPSRGPGRPPEDRRALARAFVAKAMLGIPTTNALIERLAVDKSLRRILGWERRSQLPSEATFSPAFAEFARGDLPDKMHAALIARTLGGRIVGVISRDATEIEAREKPAKKETNDNNDDPPPPDTAAPPRKRGRPRKDEQRPKPEPTRLERQTTQNLGQMFADLPIACDVGCKKNSKGYKETWNGYSSRKLRQRCLRRIFVLSGTWWVNSGDDFDPKNAAPVPAGGSSSGPHGRHYVDPPIRCPRARCQRSQ